MTNRIKSPFTAKPAGILFLGDSIAAGVCASSAQTRNVSDTTCFSTMLTRQLNETGGSWVEINVAVSGSTLAQSGYPLVLPHAVSLKPKCFVIQHGVNDNAVGVSLGEFLWSYRETVRTVRKALPNTVIVCMTVCPSWGHYNSDPSWVNLANIGIQEIAALEHTLVAQLALILRNRQELFPDSIHPNDEGHRLMAKTVLECLRNNRVQSLETFDCVVNGPGTYRICRHIISAGPDPAAGNNGWIEIRGLSPNGFDYRSDYPTDITTPFGSCDGVRKALMTTGANTVTIPSSQLSAGRLFLRLPAATAITRIKFGG